MNELPTFFFSYARPNDQDRAGAYIRQFFKDLHFRLADWAGHNVKEGGDLGTIDIRIDWGADWDDKLSNALATSRILVLIETPLYYRRENCGKELGAFIAREGLCPCFR